MTTETQTTTEAQNQNEDELVELLVRSMNAEQLRRFAHHHDVSRERGDDKQSTARKIVRTNPEAAEMVDLSGDFVVYCGHCGTRGGQRFQVSSAEEAVDEAKGHKSRNPTHFPIALDISREDEDRVDVLYGR